HGECHAIRWFYLLQSRRRRAAGTGRPAWSAPLGEAMAPAAGAVDLPGSDRAGGDAQTMDVDPGGAGRLEPLRAAGLPRGGVLALGEPRDRALAGDEVP